MNITTAPPRHSDRMFVAYSVITFITCLVIFRLIAPRLSSYFIPAYCHLSKNYKLDWNSTVVSQCFAMSISCVTVYGFVSNDGLYLDAIWGSSSVIPLEFGLAVGYMTADIVIKLLEPSALYQLQYICHHVAVLVGVISAGATGSCAFFVFHRFMHEVSNIFLNFLKFFNFLGVEKKSPLYLANGIVFTVMFFFCRIAIMPWYWNQFYYGFWGDIIQPPLFMLYVVIGVGVALDVMNVYWFYFIVKGLITVLRKEENSSKKLH